MENMMMKQVVPLQPMEGHGGTDIHTAAHGGPHTGAGGSDPKKTAAHGEPTLEQAFWQEPGGSPSSRGHMLEQSIPEGLYPVKRTHAGAGEQHEEEGAAETKHYELTATPIPHPPVPLQGRR
ncbi:zinc finger and BTB domain-containing protein 5 [Grus japonensis]|uniref:Zinc finger and BTB domain-containing protein 5 n=1 Tax=Grus japonensis TaxID=30415 RepID=A0ABC9WM75_GRUJA